MAIDSAKKRRQALRVATVPVEAFLPSADGTIGDTDKAFIWFQYYSAEPPSPETTQRRIEGAYALNTFRHGPYRRRNQRSRPYRILA